MMRDRAAWVCGRRAGRSRFSGVRPCGREVVQRKRPALQAALGPTPTRPRSAQSIFHFKQADQVVSLVTARENAPDIGFMARLLALCSLPRTNPGKQLQYMRVNGPCTLVMSCTGRARLPYGILPRLVLAWVCSEAVRTQTRVRTLGASLPAFMRKLGIENYSGGERGDHTRHGGADGSAAPDGARGRTRV